MTRTAWLVVPIAVVVAHRLASVGGSTVATTSLLLLAAATFASLVTIGLIIGHLGVRSPAVGLVLALLFWLSAPSLMWSARVGETRIDREPIVLGPATRQRDLIVVMVDDYPSSAMLLADHGYDNSEFQRNLADRGFHAVPEAWSNSSHPLLAIAVTLAGGFPDDDHWHRRQLAAMAEGDNPVADLLRDNRYSTTHLGTPSATTVWFRGPDSNRGAGFDDLDEAIGIATGNETADFVFAHITGCDADEEDTAAAVNAAVADTICNNRAIGRAFENLDTETIVVVAGTRGARIDDDLGVNPAAWPRSAIIRGLGVFAAIRPAPDCQRPPDDATVAIIAHHAVACALGVDPEPPPERAVVLEGDPGDPDGRLEVNLNVLRSDLSGQNMTTTR